MNRRRLHRAAGLVLAVGWLALSVNNVLAVPVVLPQPGGHTATPKQPLPWHALGTLHSNISPVQPAPAFGAQPPVPVPPAQGPVPEPPVNLPLPALPDKPRVPELPISAPKPTPPEKQPAPEPPAEPPVSAPPTVGPVPTIPAKKPAPVRPGEPTKSAPPVPSSEPGKSDTSVQVTTVPESPKLLIQSQATITPTIQAEFLVKFAPGYNVDLVAQSFVDLQAQVIDRIPQLGVDIVRITSTESEVPLNTLRRLGGISYIEPNYIVRIMDTPNDPDFMAQWHLEAIRAPQAWDLARGDGVVIAVVDTGVDVSERDLKNQLVPGHNFVHPDATASDDQGHGTRIALIAAAIAGNDYGGAGIAHHAQIMPLKALDHTGTGTHAWIAKAIIWAADNGANIINLSIGGPYPSETLRNAVNYAWRRGVLLVAAAGNEGSDIPVYPAAYDGVLAVAGTSSNQQRATFSNWGDYVGVAAPGTDILVTHDGNQQRGSGTSLASPQVSGIAALVLSRNPSLSGAQIRDIIQTTAHDLGSPGWDPYYGFGQVDAYEAVSQASRGSVSADPISTVVRAVNGARVLRGLPTVHLDAGLTVAAQRKAESLTLGCMSHSTSSVDSCLAQIGSALRRRQEVVLVGVSSPQAVVDLLAATTEGQQLLFGPYWQIGIGYMDTRRGIPSQVWILRFANGRVLPRLVIPAPVPGSNRR